MKLKTIIISISVLFLTLSCKEQIPQLQLQEELILECEEATVNVPVTCNVDSKAVITYDQENDTDWILLLPRVLYGNGILTFFVSAYDAVLADRTATLTVTAGEISKSMRIVQKAKDGISLSKKLYNAPDGGGSLTVTVGANTNWTASVTQGADWVKVTTGAGGQGENPMALTIDKVSGIGPHDMRVAVVHVATDSRSEDLRIYQGFGVILNGLRWADCNVGEFRQFSSSPDDIGCMYQFDSPTPWPGTGDAAPSGYQGGWTDCGHSSWEPEKDPSPEGWRLPTMQEFEALCGWDVGQKKYIWLEPSVSGFSVPGAVVGLSQDELAGATASDLKGGIFIPRSGYRAGGSGSGEIIDKERAAVQTNTTPNENWDRYVYCLGPNDWGKSWGDWEIKACVRSAFPIRCVAPVPE